MKMIPFFLLLLLSCSGNIDHDTKTTPSHAIVASIPPNTVQHSLRILYIGNMGVLIADSTRSVLIDGFHRKYKPQYLPPSRSLVSALMTGDLKDYPPINALLFTHQHKDHFDARYAHLFRYSNPEVAVLGASQITNAIAALDTEKRIATEALKTIPYDGKKHKIELETDFYIEAFRCDHSWTARHGATQNVAYIVNIGDYRILHVGDTDWEIARPIFEKQALKMEGIDVAILPYWLLQDSHAKTYIEELIGDAKIIATHINPSISEQEKAELLAAYPEAELFVESLESVALE